MGVNARQTKLGINIGTAASWGVGAAVATAVGAGDGHYVRDDLGIQLKIMQSEDQSAGQNFIGAVEASNIEAIQASIPTWLHYGDGWMNVLWALALGTGGTAPSQVGTSTVYTNTFEIATNKTGRYATIVRDKVQYISEVPGAKVTGFELRTGENGRFEIDFTFIGDTEKTGSTINTATQISALTFPTLGQRAFFDDLTFYLNTAGGGALGTTDIYKVTSVRVKFSQPLDVKHVGGVTTIVEPEESGFPEVEIEVTFPRFDATSDDFFAGHRDLTKYKAALNFAGPAITTATSYTMQWMFPYMYVKEFSAPVPGGAGQSTPRAVFRALATTTAPTGFTGTTPIRIVTTGISSANPFA